MADDKPAKSKHRSHKGDKEHKSKKRHRHEHDEDGHKSKKRKSKGSKLEVVDDDPEEDVWVEKNIDMDGEYPIAQDIPTADSLKLKSRAEEAPGDPPLPESAPTETRLRRDDWMLEPEAPITVPTERGNARLVPTDESLTDGYGDVPTNSRAPGGGVDFFSSLGTERVKKPPPNRPNPDELKIHSKELNTQLKEGKHIDEYTETAAPAKALTPGGPGSQWRMMRLRRVYETAEEEGRPIEEVAQERFGSLEAFEQAKEERAILDEREGGGQQPQRGRDAAGDRKRQGQFGKGGERGFMFNDPGSGASSRSQSFKRPAGSGPSTPSAGPSTMGRPKYDSMRISTSGQSTSAHTPVPNVLTPQPTQSSSKRAMSPSSLNKLQAKVLRAKLMGAPDAEALEKEYESEMAVASGDVQGGVRTRVEMLPTLDAQGRLYDVGQGKDDGEVLPGNRKKKEKQVETRDSKTGDIVRINADDDDLTLGDLVRQERFGAGISDQKDMDAQFARSIMTDNGFQNDLDYIDDNAEKLGRQKMRSDAMKRQFAINDYKKTQKALASCQFCYGEDDSLPKAPMVATGTRVYLSCTTTEELVKGHCLIVPMQHCLSMLEADDDAWDEVRNFMKSLMRMFAEQDMGVVFYETVLNLKWQKHTVIECVPLPWEKFDLIPGYFKESILMSEAEWSQHKKLIDFSSRPGGFRRSMVPNLPYFMVQFDYKGEKGYGHVIEFSSHNEDPDDPMDEGEKGGGDFPSYFAAEILGNVLEVEPPGKWRRPRKLDFRGNRERVERFRKGYDKFDWTGMLRKETA